MSGMRLVARLFGLAETIEDIRCMLVVDLHKYHCVYLNTQ